MHIPDGYLSPIFSLGTGVVAVPAWTIAARRVRRILDSRTVPLLAVFSAFCFTVQMFNVPVPLGTTAHAVGGTLMAIVLGPWAAVIGLSVAIVIQALFFGDGGILAVPVNCLNMAVILPFAGYATYRLLAAGSPPLSGRRVLAAGVGGFAGITVAALAVGVDLGLQPALFASGGRALYSPYPLQQTVPAMLLTHVFGAALVEGLVTGLAVAYLQRRHPSLLGTARARDAGARAGLPPAAAVAGATVAVLALLTVAALVTGGGDPARAFGADWSQVEWGAVGFMLLMVVMLAAALVPAAYLVLPRQVRGLGVVVVAMAILAPIGLIAPGFAYAEGSVASVEAEFGYVPDGLRQLNQAFTAPLSGYNLPLPFFSDQSAPLWRAALAYEISGVIGILLLAAALFGLAVVLRRAGRGGAGAEAAATLRP